MEWRTKTVEIPKTDDQIQKALAAILNRQQAAKIQGPLVCQKCDKSLHASKERKSQPASMQNHIYSHRAPFTFAIVAALFGTRC